MTGFHNNKKLVQKLKLSSTSLAVSEHNTLSRWCDKGENIVQISLHLGMSIIRRYTSQQWHRAAASGRSFTAPWTFFSKIIKVSPSLVRQGAFERFHRSDFQLFYSNKISVSSCSRESYFTYFSDQALSAEIIRLFTLSGKIIFMCVFLWFLNSFSP